MATSASTKKRQNGLVNEEGAGRSSGAKPQLLSQLPGSIFTSPGFIMGLVAVELLYGLFLFAVMSTQKRRREEAEAQAVLAAQTAVEPAVVPRVEAAPPAVPPAPPTESDAPKPAEKQGPAPAQPPLVVAQTAASTPAEPPADEEPKPKKARKSSREKKESPPDLALASPAATAPAAVEAPKPKTMETFPGLGPLVDPLQDTQIKLEEGRVTLKLAPGAHVFDPLRDLTDAPRALTEVEGDFTAEVKIQGAFQPGTEPLKGVPFTFQGAGLLVWGDKDNYIRFERAAAYTGEQLRMIYLESCKDGKPTPKKPIIVRDGAVTLRLGRRGNLINYTYSTDGKTWLKVDHSSTTLPRRVSVGISANNASPRGFSATFADFVLKPAS